MNPPPPTSFPSRYLPWAGWVVLLVALFFGVSPARASFTRPSFKALPVIATVQSAETTWDQPFKLEICTGLFCGNDPVNRHDPLGLAVIQNWEAAQVRLLNKGGFWNGAGAYGIAYGTAALNLFSFGSFGRNDALVDRNLAREISDRQLYTEMAVNTAAAVAKGAVVYGTGGIAGGTSMGTMVTIGATTGAAFGTLDVANDRAIASVENRKYGGTITGDLTRVGVSTVLGGATGGALKLGGNAASAFAQRMLANKNVQAATISAMLRFAKVRTTPLEGVTTRLVVNPVTGKTITDIDLIQDGVLWEEKTARWAANVPKWINKHIVDKYWSYIKARRFLPGLEDAPIGFKFTNPPDSELRNAIDSAVESLKVENPGVEIHVDYGG